MPRHKPKPKKPTFCGDITILIIAWTVCYWLVWLVASVITIITEGIQ